jgi:hypothetical protein
MCTLKISKGKTNLNEIENFIEGICDRYNIRNSFQGNVIIAITEMVSIVTNLGGEGKLIFENLENDFSFKYEINSISAEINTIFAKGKMSLAIESDYEKSVFLIMGLCDDFKIDEDISTISIAFKKEGIENEISSHRKEYLKNYLGKTIETTT